jgi:3-dehydroquinate synthase
MPHVGNSPEGTTVATDPLRIDVTLEGRTSRYRLGSGTVATLASRIGDRPAAALVDATVSTNHGAIMKSALADPELPVYVLPGGEQVKNFTTLDQVIRWLAAIGLTRDAVVIGVGGGTVLDLAGLAASLWQRGVTYIAVPTTLLAMVDAALGGKTAVNAAGLKNPVGTYHPAEAILADPALLTSLPRVRWREGMAELIKAAVIAECSLFAELEDRHADLAGWLASGDDETALPGLVDAFPWVDWIGRAVRVKATIVERDFREQGPRQALNLGHTLGHALEAYTAGAQRPLHHGEAVAIGMAVTARIATRRGLCSSEDTDRLVALLAACGLPKSWPPVPQEELRRLLAGDKKSKADGLHWVLPAGIGKVLIAQVVIIKDIMTELVAFPE